MRPHGGVGDGPDLFSSGVPLTDTPPADDEDRLVILNPDHPGFRDPVYRARRNAIAQLALDHREGTPPPPVAYTDQEHEVWRSVWEHLTPLHAGRAVAEWRDAAARLQLDRKWVPQLAEVNELTRHPGIEMLPVAGLISAHGFLSALGRGVFRSTQYMRHHSMPLYTPEPDVIHELVGHATSFLAPEIVRLSRSFGEAALRADSRTLQRIERVYWYTLEFGVALEDGDVKAYGAGLLSSYGELGDLGARATLVPFDLETMAAAAYDPTDYQKVLFVAPSFTEMVRALEEWLAAAGNGPAPLDRP
ncbi:MAG: phenylalanine 4-monooxygenase [Acidobacteriota bacterium]